MALEGTHIRFAIELKDRYQVSGLGHYVAGAIYPDSRYVTKIDRRLTHPADYRSWKISELDDFHKGWQTHLICDETQQAVYAKLFPELHTEPITQWSPTWVKVSALKVLQDYHDVRHFDVRAFLPSGGENIYPNGEDVALLEPYYRHIASVYSDPEPPSFAHYERKLLFFGLEGKMAKQIIAEAERMSCDERTMAAMASAYDLIIDSYKQVV